MKENIEGQRMYPDISPDLEYLEQYTQCDNTSTEEYDETIIRKYHRGLVIGRFQPLHRGHIELFKDALALANTIIIGIGSANITNEDNPFSAQDRELLLERALQREGIRDRVEKIVQLDDYNNGPVWMEAALEKVGEIDAIFGGNEWVNDIFENAGYAIERIERHGYEGTQIREELRQQGKLRRG